MTRIGTAVAGVAAVIALIAAVWFGYGWAHAVFVEKPRADAREAALDGARQAAVNLNSLDPDDLEGSVALMQSSATGDMLEQINTNHDKLIEIAGQSRAKLEAGVLSAALTELNTDDDTARALVVISQTTTPPDQGPTRQRITWSLDMREDGSTWKAAQATTLGQPVLLEGPALGPAAPTTPAPTAPPTQEGGS